VTTEVADKEEAERFLKVRDGAVAEFMPVPPRLGRVICEELRDKLIAYRTTGGGIS
jgi:hypothetical protein